MKTLFLPAILLLSFGCANGDDLPKDDNAANTENENSSISLAGTQWKLAGFVGEADGTIQTPESDCADCYSLSFNEDKTLTGKTSTTEFSGVYDVDSTLFLQINELDTLKAKETEEGKLFIVRLEGVHSLLMGKDSLTLGKVLLFIPFDKMNEKGDEPETPPTFGAYVPMLAPGNQWNELARNISLPPEYQYERTYITKLGAITGIDGVSYYELQTTRVEASNVWETVGYIREDVEQQKVYYKPLAMSEILLYVFDVQIGDVLQSYNTLHPSEAEVTVTIDSIKSILIDNILRKQIYIAAKGTGDDAIYQRNRVWIEGIGNTDGFLQSTRAITNPSEILYSILCFSNGDKLIYKNKKTGIEGCFVWRYTGDSHLE
jgi:hypothetical protein